MEQQERGIIAKLEFPLPECREQFAMAAHALDIKSVLWDLDEWLRNNLKHSSDFDEETLAAVGKHLYECLEQHNVRLHE